MGMKGGMAVLLLKERKRDLRYNHFIYPLLFLFTLSFVLFCFVFGPGRSLAALVFSLSVMLLLFLSRKEARMFVDSEGWEKRTRATEGLGWATRESVSLFFFKHQIFPCQRQVSGPSRPAKRRFSGDWKNQETIYKSPRASCST